MNLNLLTDRLRLSPLADADIDLSLEMFTDPEVVRYVCELMTETQIRQEMPNWTKKRWQRRYRNMVCFAPKDWRKTGKCFAFAYAH